MNLLSAFAGGLWIIPVGLLAAAAFSAYRGYKTSPVQGGYFKTGGGWFSLILGLAAIGSAIWMYSER